jgi:hypothetical protein
MVVVQRTSIKLAQRLSYRKRKFIYTATDHLWKGVIGPLSPGAFLSTALCSSGLSVCPSALLSPPLFTSGLHWRPSWAWMGGGTECWCFQDDVSICFHDDLQSHSQVWMEVMERFSVMTNICICANGQSEKEPLQPEQSWFTRIVTFHR